MASKRRKKRRRKATWILWALILPLIVFGIAFLNIALLLNPAQVDARVRQILSEQLTVPYRLGSVSFGFSSGLILHDLEIQSPAGSRDPTILRADEIRIELRQLALLRGHVAIDVLRVEKPHLHLERNADGELNLFNIFKKELEDERRDVLELPEITIRDIDLTVCPESLIDLDVPVKIPLLTLSLPERAGGDSLLDAKVYHPELHNIILRGKWNARAERFSGEIRASEVVFGQRLRKRLPESWRHLFDTFNPEGMADMGFNIVYEGGEVLDWQGTLDVRGASFFPTDFPLAIRSLSGSAKFLPSGRIEITRPFQGQAGQGNATVEGFVRVDDTGILDSKIDVTLDELDVGPDTYRLLEPYEPLVRTIDNLSPTGTVEARLHASGAGFPPEKTTLTMDLQNVTLTPRAFPYPIPKLGGTLAIDTKTKELTLDIKGGTIDTPVKIWGGASLESGGPVNINALLSDLALDEDVERALSGPRLDLWRSFDPGGYADVQYWLHRAPEEIGKPKQVLSITGMPGRGMSMRYYLFPYEIEQIIGTVSILEDRVQFPQELHGIHPSSSGPSRIALKSGIISWNDDGLEEVDLKINSPNLLIEPDLLAALPEKSREVVESFGLSGRLDTTFEIGKKELESDALKYVVTTKVASPCGVRYEAFPYELTLVQGTAIIDFTDQLVIQLQDFLTDATSGPRIGFSGTFHPAADDPEKQTLHLKKIEVTGLAIDPKLRQSMPADLRNFVKSLKMRGTISGTLDKVIYTYRPGADGSPTEESVEYSGDISVQRGFINFGLGFNEIRATAGFIGEASPGRPLRFSGTANLAEFRFSRLKFRDTNVVFYYGEQHNAIERTLAQTFERPDGSRFVLGSPFLERLNNDRNAQKALQIYVDRGDLYGGNVEGFVFVDVGRRTDFHGKFVTYDVDLSQGAMDIFRDRDVKGMAWGDVSFGGNTQLKESLRGGGSAYVKEGRLKKLEGLARIIKLTSNPTKPLYIDTMNVHRFSIENDRFVVKEFADMSFECEGSKIMCKGTMDFEQNVDLTLDPEFISKLPFVPEFVFDPFKWVLGSLKRVKITGPIEEPTVIWAPVGT